MKRFFLLIPSLFLLISASAQEFITAEDGSMSFGGLQWSFHGFAPGWKLFPVTRAFSPGKAEIRWDRLSSALDLSFRLRHPAPRPVELLYHEVVDGQEKKKFPELSHTKIRELDRLADALTSQNSITYSKGFFSSFRLRTMPFSCRPIPSIQNGAVKK